MESGELRITTITLLFIFVFVIQSVEGWGAADWRLLAPEIDSETISSVSYTTPGNIYPKLNTPSSTIWNQPYARVRELTSYYDNETAKPYVVFNGGGSSSIYKYDIKAGNINNLVDGSLTNDYSFGRMIAYPDQHLLLIVDVSRYQILSYRLSSGLFIGTHLPFGNTSSYCSVPKGLTFISPVEEHYGENSIGGVPPISYYAWNQGAKCLIRVVLATDTVISVRVPILSSPTAERLTDVVQDPAGNIHLLYSNCDIKIIWVNSVANSVEPRFSLMNALINQETQQLSASDVASLYCHQMAFHLEDRLYLITIPAVNQILVVNAKTGVINVTLSTRYMEPYSIATSYWNENIVLVGGGISLYGSDFNTIYSNLSSNSIKDDNTAEDDNSALWTDMIYSSRVCPVPDISHMVQKPQAMGGSLYAISGTKGYTIAPISTTGYPRNQYNLISMDSQASLFYSMDAITFFPSTKCQRRHMGELTAAQVHMYVSGLSVNMTDNIIYDVNDVPMTKMFSTGDPRVRILTLDHHPFYAILCAGLSNGNVVCIDTNKETVIMKLSLGTGSRISSLIWDCSNDNYLYLADSGKNRVIGYFAVYNGYTLEVQQDKEYDCSGLQLSLVKSLVQDPFFYNVYIILQGESNQVGILNKTGVGQVQLSGVFPQKFSTLFFQSIPATQTIVQAPLERSNLDQVPSSWLVFTTFTPDFSNFLSPSPSTTVGGTVSSPIETEMVSEATPLVTGSGKMAPTKSLEQRGEGSVQYVLYLCLVLFAVAGIIILFYLGVNGAINRYNEKEWNKSRAKVTESITSNQAFNRFLASTALGSRTNPFDTPPESLSEQLPSEKNGVLFKSEKDDDFVVNPMARLDDETTTGNGEETKLRRLLKMIGLGGKKETTSSLYKRHNSGGGGGGGGSRKGHYTSSTEGSGKEDDRLTLGSITDCPPSLSRGSLPLRPLNVGNGNQSSEPDTPVGEDALSKTPQRRISPRDIPDSSTASRMYNASTDAKKSRFAGGQVVNYDPETGEMQQEIDLDAYNNSDDEGVESSTKPLTPKSSPKRGEEQGVKGKKEGSWGGRFTKAMESAGSLIASRFASLRPFKAGDAPSTAVLEGESKLQ